MANGPSDESPASDLSAWVLGAWALGRAIRAQRFYRTLKSALRCLVVEPKVGVHSGPRYFETRP